MGKILKIEEKVPRPSKLPDGLYTGVWGGYVIEVRHNDHLYQLTTDEGVRGMGIRVVVNIKGEDMTFTELKN